ncbi:MauE/DoxX family redox-associated membrane protein [Streptomyces bauhiniae]|uniref:MauE/DoxX family redox-associated membrane protein n=1 Tax=Streptomyces bauhiniae TaxID=2340725 RepID=UPI003329173B
MKLLFIFCQLSLVSVFAASAFVKVRDVEEFVGQIRAATAPRIGNFSSSVAALVIAAEFLTVSMLLTAPLAGFGLAVLLLTVFTAHLARVIRSGIQVSCGCTGTRSNTPVSGIQIIRNVLLAAFAIVGCLLAGTTVVELQVSHLLLLGPAALFGLGVLHLQEMKELLVDGLIP